MTHRRNRKLRYTEFEVCFLFYSSFCKLNHRNLWKDSLLEVITVFMSHLCLFKIINLFQGQSASTEEESFLHAAENVENTSTSPLTSPGTSIMTIISQFFLLMWKNGKMQMRSPIWTLFEILLPVAVVLIICRVNATVGLFIEWFIPILLIYFSRIQRNRFYRIYPVEIIFRRVHWIIQRRCHGDSWFIFTHLFYLPGWQ